MTDHKVAGFTPHGEVTISGPEAAVKFVLDTLAERENVRAAMETVGYSLPEVQGTVPCQQPEFHITAREVCSLYPNFDLAYQTGGGCTAFMHPTKDGGYLLVTTPEEAEVPSEDDTEVRVGRYTDEGDMQEGIPEDGLLLPVTHLEAWIDRQLGFGPEMNS